jgi:cytochrome c oxidase cbb3-type subunit III
MLKKVESMLALIFLALGAIVYLAAPPRAGAGPGGNAAAGRDVHVANCLKCHGAGGKGDGPAGKLLKTKPADWTDRTKMSQMSDADLFNVIKNGGGAVGKSKLMPAWGGKLSDQQINDVIAFIRSL